MTTTSIRMSRSTLAMVARQAVVAGVCISLLGGCATFNKVAFLHKKSEPETAEDATNLLAGFPTAPTSGTATGYIDPMVTTAHARKPTQTGLFTSPARPAANGKPAQNALTQTYSSSTPSMGQSMAQATPPSMAGVVTEPTDVRAGNTSIFAAAGPGPAMPPMPAHSTSTTALDSPYPAQPAAPAAAVSAPGVNAMARSVFSTGTPVACGNDANGNMIRC
ncbi:hypothetical protein [Neorhizobium sp. NCHU2750]|uniref:hypothetical protein n=1 Tax=Neorhizobium sp. NCHU2750 TaxID=1825976 RepID=UPI000E70B1D9|nr:hypothetical protein NCHU2750_15650 [Neorhizobium sp. NCHU2750]